MPRSIYISITVFLAVALSLSNFLDEPVYGDLHRKLDQQINMGQTVDALGTMKQILKHDFRNIDIHYKYITTWYEAPNFHEYDDGSVFHKNDDTLVRNYYELSMSEDEALSDIGHYGLGLIAALRNDNREALNNYNKVRNRDLKYLNNSTGYAYQRFDSLELAERFYLKEIELNGNLSGAYGNLTTVYFLRGEMEKIYTLLDNPDARQFFHPQLLKLYHLMHLQIGAYLMIHVRYITGGLNFWGFSAALLILLIWLFYLRRLDIFEPEKLKYLVSAPVLGMVFSFFTGPITDILNLGFHFSLNGELLNDFFYCFIGIGMIEEFVKIIPLIILLKTSRIINEPYDYILYGSLSALGFAFIENLIYFDEYRLHIIHGRALSAAIMHMFLTSVIAYGLVLNRYKRHKNKYWNFIFFFLLSSLLHGVYDLVLLSPVLYSINVITIIIYVVGLTGWNTMINNALNHSEFFDKTKLLDNAKMLDYLIYGLAGILLFEYLALMFRHGPSVANTALMASVFGGTFMIIFISSKLSNFYLYKGAWAPVKIRDSGYGDRDMESAILMEGVELTILPFSRGELASRFLPGSGEIIKRFKLSDEPDWFLVKLNKQADVADYLRDQVMIRVKDNNMKIIDEKMIIALFAIPDTIDLAKPGLKGTDLSFCGWAVVE
jgi:protease PrsW